MKMVKCINPVHSDYESFDRSVYEGFDGVSVSYWNWKLVVFDSKWLIWCKIDANMKHISAFEYKKFVSVSKAPFGSQKAVVSRSLWIFTKRMWAWILSRIQHIYAVEWHQSLNRSVKDNWPFNYNGDMSAIDHWVNWFFNY